ncbi:MAG: lysophospholipid acyltransferase family protein [Syntrophothermus sp.]
MQYLVYLIFRWNVFLFRLMPFRLVYLLSDMVYFFLYHVARYRTEVVTRNLKASFPEKSEKELTRIKRRFYHHLCDVLMESVKVYHIPAEKLSKRYRFINPELPDSYADKGISMICVAGHYNNWEWGGIASAAQLKHRSIGFYKPLSNPYIDGFIAKHRAAGKNRVASIERTQHTFQEYADAPSIFYMIADQSPPSARMVHWCTFLNQDTAVISGPDRYARIMGMPVIYAEIAKIRRGYYEVEFKLLSEDPKSAKTGEITAKYMNALENSIKNNPPFYLWSHRRWKHKREK